MDEETAAKKDEVLGALMLVTMASFTELKAMKNPPQLIKEVLIGVNELLFGIKGGY